MCDWQQTYLKEQHDISATVQYDGSGELIIRGQIRNADSNAYIVFWAANPPGRLTSYSGSSLPYPNAQVAYESSPNRGTVKIQSDGAFSFSVRAPSGYYTGLGSVYMKPHVYIQVNTKDTIGTPILVRTGEGTPFRLLTYPPIPETAPRCSPLFYAGSDTQPVRTQEQILRDSAYPHKMPANFWGLRPPR